MARMRATKHYGRMVNTRLLMNDPRPGHGDVHTHSNTSNMDARAAMAGIVLTEGPSQRGGWVTTLQCSRCKRFLHDGERGYHINTHIVNDQGSSDVRQLICGACFVAPRTPPNGGS